MRSGSLAKMNLARYYDCISKVPILTKEEEQDLFLELDDPAISPKRAEEIKNRILEANLRYVFKQAKKYSKGDPLMFEELVSAGNLGLLRGLEKFNKDRGFRFLTYAGWWVGQAILEFMAEYRLVRLPVGKQQLSSKIQKFLDSNEALTLAELSVLLPDVPAKDLRELYQTRYLTFYIEDMTEDSSFEISPIEDKVHTKMDQEALHRIVDTLPEPHKKVLQLSFGLLDGEEKKLKDMATDLGLRPMDVKAIKTEALGMLREKLGGINPF